MTIKVVILKGCDRCANLKEKFSKAGIKYYFSTCEDDPENCDGLEALVNEVAYPMVLITNSKNEIFEVLFIASSYKRLQEGAKNSGDILCVPNYSIDDMVSYVKNKLNLK